MNKRSIDLWDVLFCVFDVGIVLSRPIGRARGKRNPQVAMVYVSSVRQIIHNFTDAVDRNGKASAWTTRKWKS